MNMNSVSQRLIHPFTWMILIFATVTSAFACKSVKVPTTDTATDSLPNSLLWKIEGNGLTKPSYIFGTIHIIPKEDYFLPKGFEQALSQSDKVVFEIDMAEMNDMSGLMTMMGSLMMNDGMSLDKLLNQEDYKTVSQYFDKMGLPMFMLNRVKPMFLSVLTEMNMDMSDFQSDKMVSYENEIFEMAKKENKSTGGLESMEFQISLFDSIPYKDQAMMLLESIQTTGESVETFDETTDLYKDQNIQGMVNMISGDEGIAQYEGILLTNRNKAWIPVIENIMKKESGFFAVGAGHLAGKDGVLNLLKNKGYTLTPISIQKQVSKKV